ncbi:hypothetical protein NDU88_006691 [Pleurodeles waltl]|uniref:Uncharacterized protein n=1 Tax=Pleurodeles waltl TaxID=8319 RepID=A0AAV7MCY9_PLEWA|nr:hypothetical protein NDU88_006691 [Pleurodeles waltl]
MVLGRRDSGVRLLGPMRLDFREDGGVAPCCGEVSKDAVRLRHRSAVRAARGGPYLARRRAALRSGPTECPAEERPTAVGEGPAQENTAPGADVQRSG